MARRGRVRPEVASLWQEFHDHVNVTSVRLREWLLTRGSGAGAFGPDPDLGLPQPGRSVLAVLGKRRVDLTPEDIRVMRRTVDRIRELLDTPPAGEPEQIDSVVTRRSLGHGDVYGSAHSFV